MPSRSVSKTRPRSSLRGAEEGFPVLPMDEATLHALQIDFRAIETLGRGLQARLWDLVRTRWPMDLARWPLVSQRFMVRTYLTNRAIPSEAGDVGKSVRIVPAGGVILAMEALPGIGASMTAEIRWLLRDLPGAPTNSDAHRELRGYVAVRDDGAAFALPLSALRSAEGFLASPLVQKQLALNAAHHRALLDGSADTAFPKVDWRNLSDEERARRIAHVRSLVQQAEDAERDPPSWRDLAREAGTSVKTLTSIKPLAEAVADAERTAHERHQRSLHRHAVPRDGDRRAG